MNRIVLILLAMFCCVLIPLSASATQYWQLTFSYDTDNLNLTGAVPLPEMRKAVRTPGLTGAPMKIAYSLEWLNNSGTTLLSTEAVAPLGSHVAFAEGEPPAIYIPESGAFVVRVAGPAPGTQPERVRLRQTSITGRAARTTAPPQGLTADLYEFALPYPQATMGTLDGPLSVTKIRDTGPDDNRVVMVVMGDGYTATNLANGDFTDDADVLVNAFGDRPPWDFLFDGVNIYRIDIESNEEGVDHDPYGTFYDTYLHSSFWVNDIERLLALTDTGPTRAYAAANSYVGAGVWDVIFVLCNSTKYGGSGGAIATSSVHSAAPEIILHENGHTFGNLADEYESAYPGYPPGDYEPNVDYDYEGPGLKWLAWVEPEIPLPTPESSTYDGVVGAFEGARYLTTGIYRPWYNCLMRSLGRPFCPICQEAQINEFFQIVSIAESIDPPHGTQVTVDESGTTFAITPVPFVSGATYEWILDGTVIGETGAQLTLTNADFYDYTSSSPAMLELNIEFPTPLVRTVTIGDSYAWAVTATCDCGIAGDLNCDDAVNPLDVSYLVSSVYKGENAICAHPACPYDNGDLNCDTGLDPLDVAFLVNFVYKDLDALCDGCGQ